MKNDSGTATALNAWYDFGSRVVEAAGVLHEDTANRLIEAFCKVPRDLFCDPRDAHRALSDEPLEIGFDQRTSKPSFDARLLALGGVKKGMRVLEIGCGSGYLCALITSLGASAFGVEHIGPLAQRARKSLDNHGFTRAIIKPGDGRYGWEDASPFDAILVSTGFRNVPEALLSQLRPGTGKLVAPVGADLQHLELWENKEDGLRRFELEICKCDYAL
jgi:protein-L-isoaspartate(D-aspartate) O-methyltransferase